MPSLDTAVIVLAGIALFAAFVNGALGYGFSSLTVPVALVFYANRVLNPAVVVIEVFINVYVLLINLSGVRAVWKRVVPILTGLLPGIAVGAFVLASLQPGWIKFGTYTVILPLILLQAAGWRRPIRSTWRRRDVSPAAPSSTRSSKIPSRTGSRAAPAPFSRSRRGRSAITWGRLLLPGGKPLLHPTDMASRPIKAAALGARP